MHIQTEFKMRERLNYIKRAEISLMKVRGGATLEAALIIPIYIFTVSVIIKHTDTAGCGNEGEGSCI